jgi:pSer/pThr/pTyr-binding forkhead associated (FHA) protein
MDSSSPQEPDAKKPEQQKDALAREQQRLERAATAHIVDKGRTRPTDDLDDNPSAAALASAHELPFGTQMGSAMLYTALPVNLKDDAERQVTRWRIELHGLTRDMGPIGLDIMGDVVIGRGSTGEDLPDLDLEPYGAFEQGVSRRHAMLRPSRNSLYLIDLNSTNGTWHNALRLGSGITRALAHNDSITLGRLTFTIKVVHQPDRDKRAVTPGPSAKPADADATKPLPDLMINPLKDISPPAPTPLPDVKVPASISLGPPAASTDDKPTLPSPPAKPTPRPGEISKSSDKSEKTTPVPGTLLPLTPSELAAAKNETSLAAEKQEMEKKEPVKPAVDEKASRSLSNADAKPEAD